jgi:hypothetical protein
MDVTCAPARRILPIVFICATAGCASANFGPRIERIGKYQDSRRVEERAAEMKWAESDDVEVYVGEFPDGIHVNNGSLKVDPDSNYEVIAKVHADIKYDMFGIMGFAFYDYAEDEAWRKGFCYWQSPFVWLTLGIWNGLPWHHPCKVMETAGSFEDRRDRAIKTLRKATKAVGGEILIVSEEGRQTLVSGSGSVVDTKPWWGAAGYALRRKGKPQ